MVYKRYIVRNGKTYGPYYYESKRVCGKSVTLYVARQKKGRVMNDEEIFKKEDVKAEEKVHEQNVVQHSFFHRLFYPFMKSSSNSGALSSRARSFFTGLILGLILLFILLLPLSFVGNASFSMGTDYSDGSLFDGTFQISLPAHSNTTEYLVLTNNQGKPISLRFALGESLERYLSLKERVELPAYSSIHVPVIVRSEEERSIFGNVTIIGSEDSQTLPVLLIIKNDREQFLEVSVSVNQARVEQGAFLDFHVFLSNLGQMRRYNARMSFDLIATKNNLSVVQQGESVVVESSLSLSRRIQIPEGIASGKYFLDVSASYENSTSHSLVPLEVGSQPSFIVLFVRDYFVLILLFLFIVCAFSFSAYYFIFIQRKQFIKKMNEMQKNSIYPFPDFATLPQSKYAYIGLVADTDEKAYFDPAQLTRHTLIAGGTGSGKTVSGMVIVEELLKKGASVIVLDPIGQWTGFVKANEDKAMKGLYKKFGMKSSQAFSSRVLQIDPRSFNVDILHYMNQKGLTILRLDGLTPAKADAFIESTLEQIYRAKLPETGDLKSLVVLDEVHRLLPKYGGRKAYTKLEQAVREFRKWGVGLLMISQVLTDFKGAIRGNIGTEIQMHSRYEGDIKRVRERHGAVVSQLISKMPISIGMVESASVNKGNPYFIEFRPLLHSPLKLNEKEIQSLVKKEVPVLLNAPFVIGKKVHVEAQEKNVVDHGKLLEELKKKELVKIKHIVKKTSKTSSKKKGGKR